LNCAIRFQWNVLKCYHKIIYPGKNWFDELAIAAVFAHGQLSVYLRILIYDKRRFLRYNSHKQRL